MAANPPRPLSLRRLFLLTITLKIAASVAGWQWQSPWLLGFALPLALMALYIAIGLRRRDDGVSAEKFADSCYYLGFIFTLSSILIALMDIPSLATRLGEISVRFGAALVSTALGLIVRVYLVNFRPEFQDAVRVSEDDLLDSVRNFRTHLDLSVEKLREFQFQVHDATRLSVAQADLALREGTESQARHFRWLLEQLAGEHRKIVEDSGEHLKAATQTLTHALHDYAQVLVSGAGRFETNAAAFAGQLEARLDLAHPPEQRFADRLDPVLDRLDRSLAAAGNELGGHAARLAELRQAETVLLTRLDAAIGAFEAAARQLTTAAVRRENALTELSERLRQLAESPAGGPRPAPADGRSGGPAAPSGPRGGGSR